jgi:hypothetical protein
MRSTFAPLLISGFVILALLPATRVGFSADDAYILAHVQSADWRTRLFAFNVDRPSEDFGAWWEGVHYQRRFIRLLPSAFMSAEVAAVGQRPQRLHLVSLALHLFNVVLIYRLARRWLAHDGKAALVAAVFGVHPIVAEPVSYFAIQPVLVATTCTLLSVECWIRYRTGQGRTWFFAALAAVFAAVTSYEAAVGVPLVIAAGDLVWSRIRSSTSSWAPLAAVVALLVPYWILVKVNQAGAVALETSHRPTVAEAWSVGRVDLANYFFKALGLIRPDRAQDYWVYNALGEPLALLLLMLAIVPVVWWARRRPLALFGLLVFLALLGPPWLVRATVGTLNIPSSRALYLPLLGLAMVVGVALSTARFRNAVLIALPLLAAACIVDRQPHGGLGFGGASRASAATRTLLNGIDPARPVIIVGSFAYAPRRAGCLYEVSLDWPGRAELRLVPPGRSGASPHLTRTGERTFTASAPDGFFLPMQREPVVAPAAGRVRYSPGGFRVTREPPPLVLQGSQHLSGATVEIETRDGDAIRSLRYTLDRPLDDYVFLAAEGCSQIAMAVLDIRTSTRRSYDESHRLVGRSRAGGRVLKARGYGFESLKHQSLPRSISCTSSTTTTRLVSTVEDLVRFDVALRTGRPLKSSTTGLIETPGKLNTNLMIARNGAARINYCRECP